MTRKLIALSLAAVSVASSLSAQILVTATTGPVTGPFVADRYGELLPAGNEVRIGYFQTGFDPMEFNSDIRALTDNFMVWGSLTIRDYAGMLAGGLPPPQAEQWFPSAGIIASQVQSESQAFAGRPIHLMIFKTEDNEFAASDLSNVQEFGVFGSPENPDWVFLGGLSGESAIETSQITQYIAGGLIENAGYVLNPENPYSVITLIPEPTTSALAGGLFAFGLLIFLRRRRNA